MFGKVLNMSLLINMLKFRWQSPEYCRVFNIRALHSNLNIANYALTEFCIYLRFSICQYSEYGSVLNIQRIRRVLHMPQDDWIFLNKTWICLNMSEFTIIDRALNMSNTIQSERSPYKLMSSYWKMGVFRTLSNIKDRTLWKNNYSV